MNNDIYKLIEDVTKSLNDDASELWTSTNDDDIREKSILDNASMYLDYKPQTNFSCIRDFLNWAYQHMDEIIPDEKARNILTLLNKYVARDSKLIAQNKRMYGNRKKFFKISKLFCDIEQLMVRNIWDLKFKDRLLFIEVIKVASRDNQAIIDRPIIAHQALLRFYATSLLVELESTVDNSYIEKIPAEFIGHVVAASKAIFVMEECTRLSNRNYLERLRKEARQHTPYKDNFRKVCEIAEDAWKFGCELLHTQMAKLIMDEIGIRAGDYPTVCKELLKVTGARARGAGHRWKELSCPCKKHRECPTTKLFKYSDDHAQDSESDKRVARADKGPTSGSNE
jgi:hypothetical protein